MTHNDVVEYLDAEELPAVNQLLRHRSILWTWRRVAGRMVMPADNRAGVSENSRFGRVGRWRGVR